MSLLADLSKGQVNRRDNRIDGLTLSTPIAMVDAIALVMALEQSRAHEVDTARLTLVRPECSSRSRTSPATICSAAVWSDGKLPLHSRSRRT